MVRYYHLKQAGLPVTLAIMSAMHEENASIVQEMDIDDEQTVGSRTYYRGTLLGKPVVVVFSHWGKVAASITATSLINLFNISEILFTGVAGAVDNRLSVGDIVIGTDFYQHDMDASPIISRHEIPLLGRAAISANAAIGTRLEHAANAFINDDFGAAISGNAIEAFSLEAPRVLGAAVASGDQFISSPELSADIVKRLPGVACVEMEGAAVAQVCESFDVPFGVVRTISDGANESSDMDFQAFINNVARVYSLGIVKRYLS